jgi:predicted nicotinamide N-methyase
VADDLDTAPPDVRAFIAERLPLQTLPDVPEVRLHLAGPRTGLHRLAEQVGAGFGVPYWAFAWAGGVALARYILDHPERVRGRRVLDFGAGCGLVAIAAALAGADLVEATDVDPLALIAALMNAEANGVTFAARLGAAASEADLVCAGDVFYAPAAATASLAFLETSLTAGAEVLIGDPWRTDLPASRLRLIEDCAVHDFGDARPTRAGVFTLTD